MFKLITSTASEYLFQAENDKDMVDWVKAIEANRHPDKEVCLMTIYRLSCIVFILLNL